MSTCFIAIVWPLFNKQNHGNIFTVRHIFTENIRHLDLLFFSELIVINYFLLLLGSQLLRFRAVSRRGIGINMKMLIFYCAIWWFSYLERTTVVGWGGLILFSASISSSLLGMDRDIISMALLQLYTTHCGRNEELSTQSSGYMRHYLEHIGTCLV